jgi:hypothetical protein
MNPTHPPLTTQIASFGKALVAEAGAIVQGQEPVTQEEHHRRLSICVSCPYYDNGKCLLCGCNMDVKTGFRTASCADKQNPKW